MPPRRTLRLVLFSAGLAVLAWLRQGIVSDRVRLRLASVTEAQGGRLGLETAL